MAAFTTSFLCLNVIYNNFLGAIFVFGMQMFYALRSLRKEGESGLWIGPLETLFPLGAPSFLPLERRRTGYRRGLRWMIFMAFPVGLYSI